MSTERPRIQVTIDEQINGALAALAVKRQMSKSALAASLIADALETQEDIYFSELSERRLAETTAWVSSKDAWGHE